jgi:hypothetical protein
MPRKPQALFLADILPGWHLTPEEVEFGLAMRRYQLKFRRRYPAWSEVLHVLHCLGYRHVATPDHSLEAPRCSDSPASVRSYPTAA